MAFLEGPISELEVLTGKLTGPLSGGDEVVVLPSWHVNSGLAGQVAEQSWCQGGTVAGDWDLGGSLSSLGLAVPHLSKRLVFGVFCLLYSSGTLLDL